VTDWHTTPSRMEKRSKTTESSSNIYRGEKAFAGFGGGVVLLPSGKEDGEKRMVLFIKEKGYSFIT